MYKLADDCIVHVRATRLSYRSSDVGKNLRFFFASRSFVVSLVVLCLCSPKQPDNETTKLRNYETTSTSFLRGFVVS